MYYYYIDNGIGTISLQEPKVPYVERKKAIPVPNKEGFIAVLNVDTDKDEVWYELEETDNHINYMQIEALKKNLSDTDYQAIKYAEGQITEEDYTPIKAQRQAWRDEINRLEAKLNESTN